MDGFTKATDLKQKMVDTFKNTMVSISDFRHIVQVNLDQSTSQRMIFLMIEVLQRQQ